MLANMRQCLDPSSFAAGQTHVKTLDSWSVDGGGGGRYILTTALGQQWVGLLHFLSTLSPTIGTAKAA